MTNKEAATRLEVMRERAKEQISIIRRKRAWLQSEKAMAMASCQMDIDAINVALISLAKEAVR